MTTFSLQIAKKQGADAFDTDPRFFYTDTSTQTRGGKATKSRCGIRSSGPAENHDRPLEGRTLLFQSHSKTRCGLIVQSPSGLVRRTRCRGSWYLAALECPGRWSLNGSSVCRLATTDPPLRGSVRLRPPHGLSICRQVDDRLNTSVNHLALSLSTLVAPQRSGR